VTNRSGAALRIRKPLIALLAALPAFLVAIVPAHADTTIAVLQALDKVTARVSKLDAPIGMPVQFGTLVVTVRACHKTPPEEPPEAAAYLEIEERRPNETATTRFRGWMFASSPGLSSLEHPVYDIWVLDCRVEEDAPSQSPDG